MKYSLWLCLTLLMLITARPDSYSQKNKKQSKPSIALADKYYDNMEFFLAAQEYKKVTDEEPHNNYAVYRVAEANRMFFHYEEAERYYKKSVSAAIKDYPLARYWYGQMLKMNGKYEEADKEFEKFLNENHSTDSETKKYKEIAEIDKKGCELAINEMKKPVRDYQFEGLKSPLNTSHSDYAPVIFEHDSSLVITSAREESTGDLKHGWLGGDFSDNFRFEKTKDSWVKKEDNDKFSVVNSKYNESSGSFNKDKTKFYFTRCDEAVTVNNVTEYQCAIYVVKFEGGKWSNPVKLNQNVNMAKQWNAQPSVSPNADTLFFVSKRPGGYGMHDIWISTCSGDDNWGAAINMGPEINTANIDMSPCYYPIENTLFFSSNGREGFGGLDIFMARGENFSVVKNAGLPFNSNRDDFYFVMGEKKGYLASNREGGLGNDDIYLFNIESKEAVIAAINKDSLDPNAKSISIVGTLIDEETNLPAADAGVILKDGNNNNVLKKTTTNDQGKFRYENLPPDNYKVTLDDKNSKITADIKYLVDDVKVKGSEKVVSKKLFENIYFDFDRQDIRPEAKKVLDELLVYLKKYPEVQIEMNANTDNFGTDEYNFSLSERRGKAAFDYMKTKGVDKSALIHALGAGKPLVANSNVIARQLNRRVEFYIIGGPGYEAKAMTYVIEPKMTLFSVAKKYNMTVEELKELNNLDDEKVLAYRPLRVKRTGDQDIIAPVTLSNTSKPGTVPDEQPEVKHKTESVTHKAETGTLKAGEQFYTVEPKNTVYSISKMFGMTPEELRELNGLKNNDIVVGQRLKVRKK